MIKNNRRYYINGRDVNHMSIDELRQSLARTLNSLTLLKKLFPSRSENLYIKKKRLYEKKILQEFLLRNGERYYDLSKIKQKMKNDELLLKNSN